MKDLFSFPHIYTDVLVLGAGVAGRRAAIAAAQSGVGVTLAYLSKGASPFLLGCNAVLPVNGHGDDAQTYAEDTIRGGYELNDDDLVESLAQFAPTAIQRMIELGVPFASAADRPKLRHLSGNTFPRSLYVEGGTGNGILKALEAECRSAEIVEEKGMRVLTLVRQGTEVVGAILVEPSGGLVSVRAHCVVVALGGLGRAYRDSTYPADVTSTSYGLMLRAGATLIDMEFVQFEPTVTVHPEKCAGMEMPTAMLGDGAVLRNSAGKRFMLDYNPGHGEKQIEKAKLSLFIQKEIDEGRGFPDGTVAFDCSGLPESVLESYVVHRRRLLNAGLDIAETPVRVRPAAHSMMGGARIDTDCWTGIPGLFACGEAAGGVHGASRLAGNGGTDSLVFGAVAGCSAAAAVQRNARDWETAERQAMSRLLQICRLGRAEFRPELIAEGVRSTLSVSVGIYREAITLQAALSVLDDISRGQNNGHTINSVKELSAAVSAFDLLLTARATTAAALARKESRGAHQRRDFPRQNDEAWRKHLTFKITENCALIAGDCPVREKAHRSAGVN